jgi:hypothetical protein
MASVCRQLVRVVKRSTAALSNALSLSWVIVTRTTGQSMCLVLRLNVLGRGRRYYAIAGFVHMTSIDRGVGILAESWFHKGT